MIIKALQAEFRSSCMAACWSALSCDMHSVHSPPDVYEKNEKWSLYRLKVSKAHPKLCYVYKAQHSLSLFLWYICQRDWNLQLHTVLHRFNMRCSKRLNSSRVIDLELPVTTMWVDNWHSCVNHSLNHLLHFALKLKGHCSGKTEPYLFHMSVLGTGAAVTHSEPQGEHWDYSMMCHMSVCKILLPTKGVVL